MHKHIMSYVAAVIYELRQVLSTAVRSKYGLLITREHEYICMSLNLIEFIYLFYL